MSRIEIYPIDCLEFLSKCESSIFDLVIADPPYFEVCGDFDFAWRSVEEYVEWSKKWIAECHRVLKSNGSMYLWGVLGYAKGYPLFKIADWIESSSLFTVRNWITQRNSRGRGTKRGYMMAREELLFMTKSNEYLWNPVYTEEPTNRKDLGFDGKPRKNSFKRCSDVWIDISEASQSSKERFQLSDGSNFPTVKALKLCERILNGSSNKEQKVYVPFGGSGSEAVACARMNRDCVVTEINRLYIDEIMLPRLNQESCLVAVG
jgi:site-specific DNA-methyltransferase (adenine-specific)